MSLLGALGWGAASAGIGTKGRARRKERRQKRRDRRSGRREDRQTGVDAPELGRDTAASGRLGGMAGAAGGRYLGDRQAQGTALDMTAAAARGEGTSVAQSALAAQSGQNISDQMGMAAAARGGNLAGQARNAAAAGSGAQMGTQQQMATLRAQEIATARGQQAAQANAMAAGSLQQQGMMEGNLLNAQNAQLGADMGQRGLNLQQVQGDRDFGLGIANQAMGVGQAAAQAGAMFSDERVKKDIRPGGAAASEAMAQINPVQYQYKQPQHGLSGNVDGVTAQDLERSPAGAQLVTDTPEGKKVNVAGGMSLALAAGADQERRIRELEGSPQAAGGGTNTVYGGAVVDAEAAAAEARRRREVEEMLRRQRANATAANTQSSTLRQFGSPGTPTPRSA